MGKKKRIKEIKIGNAYSTYSKHDNDTMTEWYEAYKEDIGKNLVIGERVYSRIIYRAELYIYDRPTFIVALEPRNQISIGDTLIDEEEREFQVKGIEMLRVSPPLPEWYFKVNFYFIYGQDYSVGNYLGKI